MRKLTDYKPTKFMAENAHYDKSAADYVVGFIECLFHTKGTWAGKPFELIDWQERIIRDIFGILKPNGYRQFNTAYVEIPKKQGKQLALDTKIPTPNGFTTMGDILVGDTVFDENGQNCRVVAKSDVDDRYGASLSADLPRRFVHRRGRAIYLECGLHHREAAIRALDNW